MTARFFVFHNCEYMPGIGNGDSLTHFKLSAFLSLFVGGLPRPFQGLTLKNDIEFY